MGRVRVDVIRKGGHMKKSFVVALGFLLFLSMGISCGTKQETAPSGADVLVLTQPAGVVPGNISAIETSTGTVYDDLIEGGTGEMPNEFQLRGSTLWIVNSGQGSVQLVEVSERDGNLSLSTEGRIYLPSGSYPEYMAFLGGKAYVTLYINNSVAILDTFTNLITDMINLPVDDGSPSCYPSGLGPWGITTSGTTLLIAGSGLSPGAIVGIDGNNGSITFSISTSRANAGSIAVDEDTGKIFVTTSDFCDSMNGSLEVFTLSGQPITVISMGTPLGAVVISRRKAYIGDLFGAKLYTVDIDTYSSKSIALTENTGIAYVSGIRKSPKGLIYACGWGLEGGEVYEIDSDTDTVKKIYTIKGPAQDVVFRK